MTFTTHQEKGQVIVRLSGLVCASEDIQAFEANIKERLKEGCREFIFNFSDVNKLTSLGVGIMVKAYMLIKQKHGRMMVCNYETIENVLRITRTYNMFDLCENEEHACSKLSRGY